jgi:hypothetical protein
VLSVGGLLYSTIDLIHAIFPRLLEIKKDLSKSETGIVFLLHGWLEV